jgi:hypothetical protein
MPAECSCALSVPEVVDTESLRRSLAQEATWSALIVGSMPLLVMVVLLTVNWNYMTELWSSGRGLAMMAGACVLWLCGVLTMYRMGRPAPGLSAGQLSRWADTLSPRMTIPMIVFILPAMFAILLGPAALQVLEGKAHMPATPAGCERP